MRFADLTLATCTLCVMTVTSASSLAQSLPTQTLELGGKKLVITRESLAEELELGRATAAQILGANRLLKDKKIQRYVNLVGRHVADQTKRKGLKWSFGVIESSAVNAFAAPGGYILITSALLNELETEDELAAVLAHEVAHVIRKHHYRVMRKQKMLEFGANAVRIEGADEVNKLSNMTAQVIARGLDKKAEFEADRDGMVYAARAGYDASALYAVLNRLGSRHSDKSNELLTATHPSFSDREQFLIESTDATLETAAKPSPAGPRYLTTLK
jgi:predicted Zn-dependent protease